MKSSIISSLNIFECVVLGENLMNHKTNGVVMLKVVYIVVGLFLLGCTSAPKVEQKQRGPAGEFEEKISQMYLRGSVPTGEDAMQDWQCFIEERIDETDALRASSTYGFTYKNGEFIAPSFGFSQPKNKLEPKNNALASFNKTDQGNIFLSIRVVETKKGRRLMFEESMDFYAAKDAVKSQVTGFAVNLYSICMSKDKLVNDLFGRGKKVVGHD